MLDKLVDVLLSFMSLFRFWEIIGPDQVGLVYTLGRDTSYLTSTNGWFGTGFHLLAPCGLEEVMTANIQWDWDTVPYQSLETKDGKPIITEIGYKFRLRAEEDKVRKFLVMLNNERNTRRIAIGAAACSVVSDSTLEELRKDEMEIELLEKENEDEKEDNSDEEAVAYVGIKKQILDLARDELTPWGYQIARIKWLQRTTSRTYRIMQDQQSTPSRISLDAEEDE